MYFDTKPCSECGAEVELRARRRPVEVPDGEPVGPGDVVGGADTTVDERVCTNPDCPTHTAHGSP